MAGDQTAKLLDLLLHGPLPARRVLDALGIARPTLGRLVRAARGRVVRIGRARATSYARVREVRTFGERWPVYRIDPSGRAHLAAHLHALMPRAWWYQPTGPEPAWLHGEFASGLFPDLPWFLDDLRPQGFMGRAFARRYGESLGLGPDPRLWDAEAVLAAVLVHGDDLPGDFVIGNAALDRVQRRGLGPPVSIAGPERSSRYPALAEAALAGEVPASSAGGEQPKFTACLEEDGGYRHVLVKFSPPELTPIGQRWADLLVCEQLAAVTLRTHGVPACDATVLEAGGRWYLEATRFDRAGAHGRHGVVTLTGLDNAYYGKLDTWYAAADRLQGDGWLPPEDADRLRVLWWFGLLIGNTDMHFGNVSLAFAETRPLALSPAYDMLPMHYRPAVTGEVSWHGFLPPLPAPQQLPIWRRAADLAASFWAAAAHDERISVTFRGEAARVLQATHDLRTRFA